MRPDKYEMRHKYYIKLQKELDKVRDKIRAIPLIPYEKPVHKGWLINFELREDIINRDDASYILEAMKVGYKPQYIYNVKHVRMMRAGQKGYWETNRRKGKHWVSFGAYRPHLHQKEYDKLHPAVQKYFYLDRYNTYIWLRDKYKIELPDYWLIPKARPRFVTHYRGIDGRLESRKSWLEDKLEAFWREEGRRSYSYSYPANKVRTMTRDMISKFRKKEIDDIPNNKIPLEYG